MSTTPQRTSKEAIPSSLQPASVGEGGLQSQDLSVGQAVRVLRKRKRLIWITALACAVLVLIVSLIIRPHYKSLAEIEIEQDQSNPLASSLGTAVANGAVPDDLKVELQSEVLILQSDDLALKAIEQTHFEDHLAWAGTHRFGGFERPAQEKGLPLSQAPETRGYLLAQYTRHLTVEPVESTRLIRVGFTDRDPNFAAEMSTALVDLYIRDRLRRRSSSTLQATEWIGAQISDINKKLEASQQALVDYQRQSGLISLPIAAAGQAAGAAGAGGTEVRSPAVDRLVQLNQSLVAAETDRIAKEAIYRVAQSGDPDTLASVAGSQLGTATAQDPTQAAMFTGLMNLRQQENTLSLELKTAAQTYGSKNPHLVDLNRQMEEIKRQIRDEVRSIVMRASLDYQTALKNENGIRAAYETELKASGGANDKQVHLAVLQQEADSTRALYEDLYTKLEQSRLSVGTQASNITVISRALPPAGAAYPKPLLYSLIGLVVGLLLGVVAAYVVESADDSIATGVEVEHLTNLPVLASIPRFVGTAPTGGDAPAQFASWAARDSGSPVSEAFRNLRANLLLSQFGEVPATILLSSPMPSEGRSTAVYNLAASFAAAGKKVLLIDADLRKPSLHTYIGSPNARGLSTALTSSRDLEGLILPDPAVPGLFVLAAGPTVSNPSELLASSRFDELLAVCQKTYDLVLLDSPPSMFVSDASILSQKVDGVVLLARSGSTTHLVLQRAVQDLGRIHANVLGVTLNAVDTSSSEYYHANGYRGKAYYGSDKG